MKGGESMPLELNLNLASFTEKHRAVPLQPNTMCAVLILGGGPAALAAAVYCMRKGGMNYAII